MKNILSQENTLQLMGITPWQAVLPLPGAKQVVNVEIFALEDSAGAEIGYLMLDQIGLAEAQEKEVRQLLTKMLAAIKLKGNFLVKAEALETLSQYLKQPKKVLLLMGSQTRLLLMNAELTPATKKVSSYHPWELIQNPQLKRQAWNDLQQISVMLAETHD